MRLATGLVAECKRFFSAVSMPSSLSAAGEDPLQSADLFFGERLRSWPYGLSEARQDLGIDPIGLSEPTRGSGEVTHLARVNYHYRQPRGGQSRNHRSLEATGGLKEHQHGALLDEARD
jgi:hypothetical protein